MWNKIKSILFLVFFIIVINTGGYIIRKIEKKKLYNREIKGVMFQMCCFNYKGNVPDVLF